MFLQVAADAVEDFSKGMGISNLDEIKEFSILASRNRGKTRVLVVADQKKQLDSCKSGFICEIWILINSSFAGIIVQQNIFWTDVTGRVRSVQCY